MKKRIQQEGSLPSISNCFIVGIDGSEGSHNAFELVLNDMHRRGLDKLILVHVFSEKDEEAGIQFHNKTIYNKYHEELKSKLHEDDYEIIFEERKPNENVFEQVNDIAVAKNASLMVLGFRGKNGAKTRPDELSKAINYLVHKPRIPVLIVKERIQRSYKSDSSFNWLVCLESPESKSFKALATMCRFVDTENDTFTAITVKSDNSNGDNETATQKVFEEKMNEYEIRKHSFKVLEREEETDIHDTIIKFIRDSQKDTDLSYDFVVCGYNPSKYAFIKDAVNTTVDIIKRSDINVFFDH
jgi:nucleotide-binding universal stress UspA family protein